MTAFRRRTGALAGEDVRLKCLSSSANLMEQEVLTYRAPVYGRHTGQYLLSALEFPALVSLFPRSGFTSASQELAAREGVILVEPGDLARP